MKRMKTTLVVAMVSSICLVGSALSATAACTGRTEYFFYDYSWKDNSDTSGPITVRCGDTIIGTNYHVYYDNIGTDKIMGQYTPVDGSGFCSISSDGKMASSETVNAGIQASTPKIDYVSGKISYVISTRE